MLLDSLGKLALSSLQFSTRILLPVTLSAGSPPTSAPLTSSGKTTCGMSTDFVSPPHTSQDRAVLSVLCGTGCANKTKKRKARSEDDIEVSVVRDIDAITSRRQRVLSIESVSFCIE
jgi:hypothetical protein